MHHIGISFGELRQWNDGLGEFSHQFGTHLAALAPSLSERWGATFYFHLPARWHGRFGHQVHYLDVHKGQRWLHLQPQRFDLWHNLHQHTQLRAPWGTRHVITTLHDLNLHYMKEGGKRWRAMQRQLRLLKRADEIVCISDHVLHDLRRLTQLSTPAHRIHNGVCDMRALTPSRPQLAPHAPFLFHIGRMTPNKNVDKILALAQIWPERQFVLAGPRSGHSEGYARQAQAAQLSNVHVLYDISDEEKAWLYAHCDGLLFPSTTEGFGLPPIEAMSVGASVYLSTATSLPEIGGQVAAYFDNFRPEAMKETIMRHESMDIPSSERRERAIAHAAQFKWSACISHYVSSYGKALGL